MNFSLLSRPLLRNLRRSPVPSQSHPGLILQIDYLTAIALTDLPTWRDAKTLCTGENNFISINTNTVSALKKPFYSDLLRISLFCLSSYQPKIGERYASGTLGDRTKFMKGRLEYPTKSKL
ncbi:hypothetical protein [Tychonema sp. LEGE 07203]|uniref:hypothetical protein n=1 Tax=Tychonema sp. LEGE 07203 TaxID=1828671 RepID=UPI0018801547|nr:hypothetical protein [Tychonema sp. LEGE 07203]MBE9093313.1 hypothetical protein [Tychonema sp. LEGE 07203]